MVFTFLKLTQEFLSVHSNFIAPLFSFQKSKPGPGKIRASKAIILTQQRCTSRPDSHRFLTLHQGKESFGSHFHSRQIRDSIFARKAFNSFLRKDEEGWYHQQKSSSTLKREKNTFKEAVLSTWYFKVTTDPKKETPLFNKIFFSANSFFFQKEIEHLQQSRWSRSNSLC